VIRESAKKSGRNPDSITAGLYAMTLVGKTHEECHELFKKPLAKAWTLATAQEPFEAAKVRHPLSTPGTKFSALTQFVPTRYTRAQVLDAMKNVPEKAVEYCLVHGTKDEMIAKVERLAKVGLQHVVFWNMTGMVEPTKNKESLEILKNILNYIKGR
jgi:phthiodiolone/phenolphthiodiolone dimycocerosates ketoreductase